MKILALDSTAEVCTVAVCEDKKLISEITVNTGNTHSETLLPAVEQALKLAELTINDIDLYACSVGPGSFTGVRIGVATIKGLAYGKSKPCVAVSTLQALAMNLSGVNGIICPVMNARRNQVYNALFSCENGKISRLCPDRAISISELDDELSSQSSTVYLCGDGHDITLKGAVKTTFGYTFEQSRLQNAYSVALAALELYNLGKYVDDKAIAPVYLRPSQAERERLERIKNENQENN